MDEDYEFVRMSDESLADFALLVRDAFGTEPTVAEMKALFDTTAWGKKYIAYIAYSRETREPAAFYGVFPCFVEYNGRQFLAAQSGSTMTHSEHRKRGLFYRTGLKTFELARAEGIHFVFGFPNPFSYPGLMKLGWTHDGNFNSYHIVVPTIPLGALAHKISFLTPLYRSLFNFVTSRWRVSSYPFANSSAGADTGVVSRSDFALNYKPENSERFMLRTGGCTIWINQQQGKIGIGDIELTDDRDFKKVLRSLKFICFLTGSFHLRTYVSPDSKLDLLFRENGYRPRRTVPICHKDLSAELPLKNFKYVYGDFDTF